MVSITAYEASKMKTIKFNLNNIPKLDDNCALCLGYFDGLHIGHRTLIESAVKENKKVGVLTFDFSPKLFLKHDDNLVLTSIEDKEAILSKIGVSYLLVMEVTNELLNVDRKVFIDEVLKRLNPSSIYCGKDFRFGKNKEGSVDDLKKNFKTIDIDLVDYENRKISSSRIIRLLEKGDIEEANILLGRYYSVKGTVVKGLGNGGRLGFKTANLELKSHYFLPLNGVYICYAIFDNKKHEAIANIGIHPSIDKLSKPIVEVHVLDGEEELLNKDIEVSFLSFIRPELKFENTDGLIAQIGRDIVDAIYYFKK